MFLLEKGQVLPVGMSRHNATTYAVIRIFLNIFAEKKIYEKLQPWSQGLEKKTFYKHFAPSHHCAMLTKHCHLPQVCILPFSNIERGNGGVDTYSVSITIMISCFWHFPTQFVHGCRYSLIQVSHLHKESMQTQIDRLTKPFIIVACH